MCAEPMRIGILGGTFDPVHLGHIASAREVAEAFSLDRVLLVLAARPPHKTADEAAPASLRWRMLELAVDGAGSLPAGATLEACDIELHRSGPSWTVDTLRDLAQMFAGAQLFLILGADAYEEIDTWSRPEEIPRLANIIVTTRPGRGNDAHDPKPPVAARGDARYDPAIGVHVHTSGHTIRGHRIRGIEVSATDIRRRVRAGLPFEHLTGDAVAHFIKEHRLYGSGGAAAPSGGRQIDPNTQGAGKHCKE